ncbi:MAG: gliding motility-associated C-terminal domain-containing protein [Bacteroidota bacterium]|nr:gliding motility-associated C-terminal domain-containing protein [Bacteroidota bacterium]
MSGASNNNLSSPTQGVCGVRIKFNHKFIGDLTVVLISPAGETIRLIGPTGNTGKTDFTQWNVTFVPCAIQAVPDVGFKQRWDNLQSWGILGQFYNGTYYPNQGCLEDFDMGTVNGTWTLSITDAENFYQGVIESFCLLFCDPTGINCMECSPNGGYFDLPPLAHCQNDPGLNFQYKPTLPSFIPDTTLYGYQYLVSSNNVILERKQNLDFSNYAPGTYQICGISYLKTDLFKIPNTGENKSFSVFRNDLVANKNGICAELSKDCIQLAILPISPELDTIISICEGSTIQIGGQTFSQSGNYTIPLKSIFFCDSIINLQLRVVQIKAIISLPIDTINCNNPNITIDASGSIKTNNSILQWITNGGNISDLSDPLRIKVNESGIYTLHISDGSCMDSISVQVYKNDAIPQLSLRSDTINCDNSTVRVTAVTNAFNAQFTWTDGTNVIGASSFIDVSQPGPYYVTVTDDQGCTNYATILVPVDLKQPEINIFATKISCRDSLATLSFSLIDSIRNFIWTGPNNYSSSQLRPRVSVEGIYHFIATGLNGCITDSTITVISGIKTLIFSVPPDTVSCKRDSIILYPKLNSRLSTIVWTGPNNFRNTTFNPTITIPGRYNVTLTDDQGCRLDTFIVVPGDTMTANFLLQAAHLNCLNDSVQIILTHTDSTGRYTYTWTGPVGFGSNKKSPFVKENGRFDVVVQSSNGCLSSDSITVIQDPPKPEITLTAPEINCRFTQVQIQTTCLTAISYNWTGPKGFVSSLEDPIVDTGGIYRLIVTEANGCTSEKSILVLENKIRPVDALTGGNFNCIIDSFKLGVIRNIPIDTFLWTGPNNFMSNIENPLITLPGTYNLRAVGNNYCESYDSIRIEIDTMPPPLFIDSDTITCKNPFFNLRTTSTIPVSQFIWTSPDNKMDTSSVLLVSTAGLYRLDAIGFNGCLSDTTIEVKAIQQFPIFSLAADSLHCNRLLAGVRINTLDTNLTYNWSGPNAYSSNLKNINVDFPGIYVVSVENEFGCITQDSIQLISLANPPSVQISDSIFNCINYLSAFLEASSIDLSIQFFWTLPDNSVLNQARIDNVTPGVYIIQAIDQNNCKFQDSILVVFDTISPRIDDVHANPLDCINNSSLIFLESRDPIKMYQWLGPSNFTSTLSNPLLTKEGFYFGRLIGTNECVTNVFLELKKDTIAPIIDAFGADINCQNSRTIIDVNTLDTGLIFNWETPMGTLLNGQKHPVIEGGTYKVIALNPRNNCLSVDSVIIKMDTATPKIVVQNVSLPCNSDSAQIQVFDQNLGNTYLWSGPGFFVSNLQNPFINILGEYYLIVTAPNFCITRDTIQLDSIRNYPIVEIIGEALSCSKNSVQLTALMDIQDSILQWNGPGFFNNKDRTINVQTAGIYTLQIINPEGCIKDTFFDVKLDTMSPSILLIQQDSLKCDQKEILIQSTVLPTNRSFAFTWYTVDGSIRSPLDQKDILIDKEGTYQLLARDIQNGCESLSDIVIVSTFSTITGLDIDVISPGCKSNGKGTIKINQILGGEGPYRFSLDDQNYIPVRDLDNLNPAIYTLYIKDRFGCEYDTLVTIEEPSVLNLELGPDQRILLGESISVTGLTTGDTTSFGNLIWSPKDFINCQSCFTLDATPFRTTKYRLQIVDEFGCTAEDFITIYVDTKPRIYIPNVFSPNGDNINDLIIVSAGSDIALIKRFVIYDRWGEVVYERSNFLPNESNEGWDGRLDGQALNPAVFVYHVQAVKISGELITLTGDITLMR